MRHWSNCLIFAFNKWRKEGGYVAMRRSHFGWWPHFIWVRHLRNAEIEHLIPKAERLTVEPVQKLLFDGEVKTEDTMGAPKR